MRILLLDSVVMPKPTDVEALPVGVIRISNYSYPEESVYWDLPTLNVCFSSESVGEAWVKGLNIKTFSVETARSIHNFLNVLNPATCIVAARDTIGRGSAVALAIAEWVGNEEVVKSIATGFSFLPILHILNLQRQVFGLTPKELRYFYGTIGLEPFV